MSGVYLVTTPTQLTYVITLPVKLFDGSTGGGLRFVATLVIWIVKLLLYLLTILFIYMAVKMFRPKKTL
jgi:fumarate reductase subunit D